MGKNYAKILIFLIILFISSCHFSSKESGYIKPTNTETPLITMNDTSQTTITPSISDACFSGSPATPTPSLSLNQLIKMTILNPKIVVYKSKRKLYLYDDNTLLSIFDIGLGFTPEGAKTVQGDGKTPEGEYYICYRNPNSKYYLSVGLSYPNKADAKIALDENRITQKIYDKIANAIDNEKRPPWDTALGGEIMIHGHGSKSDWTAGCIAVENEIMDFLYAICDLGTPVIIYE